MSDPQAWNQEMMQLLHSDPREFWWTMASPDAILPLMQEFRKTEEREGTEKALEEFEQKRSRFLRMMNEGFNHSFDSEDTEVQGYMEIASSVIGAHIPKVYRILENANITNHIKRFKERSDQLRLTKIKLQNKDK